MRKVLFVGWDAADWKVIHPLMDEGRMPHLKILVETGSMAQLATIHPPFSPMVWTSIATGKRPFKHGIHGFVEPAPSGRGVQPITNLSRACKAVWNILNQHDLRSTVIGWWPSHPAEPLRGVTVSDHFHRAAVPIAGKTGPLREIWPLPPNSIHPPELAGTLAELRFHPQELLPAMVKPFVPNAASIDQEKDRRLGGLMKTICECVTMHSAATWLLDHEPWDFFAVYYDAIDHFSHGFMRYRAPRQAWISEADFEMYQHVVTEAYVFHDQMLGTLIEKARSTAGDDLTVMVASDHGFHADHLRPRVIPDMPAGPAIEHSDFGILVVNGPGIQRDNVLFGANLLDITPTLLALYGLPVGADMDGKVLTSAFETPPPDNRVPSWEDVPGEDGRHPPHFQCDPIAANEAMEQMIALGYIERPDADVKKAIGDAVAELRYNLGESYQDADRHADAAHIFRDVWEQNPDEQRFAVHYFISCEALGRTDEMRRVVEDLDVRRRALYEEAVPKLQALRDAGLERLRAKAAENNVPEPVPQETPNAKLEPLFSPEEKREFRHWRNLTRYQPPVIDYLKGQLLTTEGKYEEALKRLALVTRAHLARPGLLLQTGDLYRKLGRLKEAEETFSIALRIDPDNPHAHLGLCRIALHRRRYQAAAGHALDCIQRLYHFPLAHFLLGSALAGMKEYERALEALRTAISLNANFPQAHLRLARLLEQNCGTTEGASTEISAEAAEHRRIAREIRRASSPRRQAPVAVPVVAPPPELPARSLEGARPLADSVIVVTGLPRSGTSMLMQMLHAGSIPVLTDGVRVADEDNPRGFFEYEPTKQMLRDSAWLQEARGKAVKIVAPLLGTLPRGLPCRVIAIERDYEEILDSQAKMIERRGQAVPDTLEHREMLAAEYARTIQRARGYLARRPLTAYLWLRRDAILADPQGQAMQIAEFLDDAADAGRMAAAVDRSLHRNTFGDRFSVAGAGGDVTHCQ